MINLFHSFHIVSVSPWPILCSVGVLGITTSFIVFIKINCLSPALFCVVCVFFISILWWRDVSREATFVGDHSNKVQDRLKWGIRLFILREGLFFLAWFWAFFHHRLVPPQEIGSVWPPIQVFPFEPFGIPLLNTSVLLSSGIFVTWAHHNIIFSKAIKTPLLFTILLGFVFTVFQVLEYKRSLFSIRDRAYGTTFFVSTGFHGVHVVIGTGFLAYCFFRCIKNQLVSTHHVGLELSIWYWHFVDVVWLFLFSFIYWWGFK